MIRINLLPVRAAQKKEKLLSQIMILILAVVVALMGCGFMQFTLMRKIGSVKADIAKTQNEINSLKKKIGEVAHYKKLQQELQGKLDVLEKLKEGRSGPVHLLDDLSKSLPDKLWLTSFKESGGSITITGIGMNEETVAQFLRDLEGSPYYQKVELQVTEQVSQKEGKLQKFSLSCRVDSPPKKSPESK